MISNQLNATEYHPYYKYYIDKAVGLDIVGGLQINLEKAFAFLSEIPEEKYSFAYAKDKWTIKDILLHIIDAERIFAYRALRIARGDTTPLAGFEQNNYVLNGNATSRTFKSITDEYKAVRNATISLFGSFNDNMLQRVGKASGSAVSVRALGYIITGHENHHLHIIEEHYL
ncbi:DinB family protein [Winogradskyella sp.]|uniref:DinB family protein n=1 Tax=Winogradskyella sp. TaxID=1883156 RepID=UPI00262F3D2E|nr:DinB family protein [Winogradskyella sp.]